jgi:hypothetical protein
VGRHEAMEESRLQAADEVAVAVKESFPQKVPRGRAEPDEGRARFRHTFTCRACRNGGGHYLSLNPAAEKETLPPWYARGWLRTGPASRRSSLRSCSSVVLRNG